MFGIGQFAQLAKVSVRTLRHYDQIGLIAPAAVDESSGYRSYRASQLPRLNRILALKDLGRRDGLRVPGEVISNRFQQTVALPGVA